MSAATDRQQFREVLAGLASKTLTKIPALNGRVEKACKLVLAGDVALLETGRASVASLTDPTRTYLVGQGACDCKDFERAPEHLCCHRLAVGFQRKALELLPEPQPTPPGMPQHHEAPASVNVRVLVHGHEVMVTLRDSDEAALLTRLGALLARKEIRPLPKPAPRQGQWPKGR